MNHYKKAKTFIADQIKYLNEENIKDSKKLTYLIDKNNESFLNVLMKLKNLKFKSENENIL